MSAAIAKDGHACTGQNCDVCREGYDTPTYADLYAEAIAHIRRTRKWVRNAEEMAPREAAQLLDRIARTLDEARSKFEQGDSAGALAMFADEEDDL